MPTGRLLSTGQAARLLNVTPDTIVKWIRKGALPAVRTAGGHYRVAPRDLEQYVETDDRPVPTSEGFIHCWEFYARDGMVGDQCRECLVYRARALRCYEMSSLSRDAGYVGTYCKTSCEECPYYLQTVGHPRRVMVVTDSLRLRRQLESDPRGSHLEIRFASCEYECSTLVESFRPEFVVLDCALSQERCNELCGHLAGDARIPGVQIILAAGDDNEAAGFGGGGEPASRLRRPFTLAQLERFVSGKEVAAPATSGLVKM